MSIKKLTLNSCEAKKEGISQSGKAWTIYECHDETGKYSSFTNFFDKVGIPTDYEVESKTSNTLNNKTGKPFVNYTLFLPKAGGRAGNTDASYELLLTKINAIGKKIDEIYVMLTEPGEELPSMDKPHMNNEGADNKVPF